MNYRKTIGRLFVSILILIFPSTAFCILFWVDLDVGDSVYFEGKEVKVLSQSIDGINVSVDGVTRWLNLFEGDCGSPRESLWYTVDSIQIMPDIVADIEYYCYEPSLDRRYVRHKVGWEIGDVNIDRDYDNAARIVLKRIGERLVEGVFPIQTDYPQEYNEAWKSNYFLSPSPRVIHSGVDFFDTMGTSILSASSGRVVQMYDGYDSGYPCAAPNMSFPTTAYSSASTGNYLIVDDGNYLYKYGHLNTIADNLSLGDWVNAGDYLGGMGCTGTSISHLHFAMFLKGGADPHYQDFNINPHPFLTQWAISGCPYPVGHNDYCTVCGPCELGEGDCDNDSECEDGLLCASDLLDPSTDTCQDTCPGDIDFDKDVDGADLADYIFDSEGLGLDEFTANFGKINCP